MRRNMYDNNNFSLQKSIRKCLKISPYFVSESLKLKPQQRLLVLRGNTATKRGM